MVLVQNHELHDISLKKSSIMINAKFQYFMHEKTEIYGIFKCSLRNLLTPNWEFFYLQLEIESWAKGNHLISIVVKFKKEKNEENKR